MAIKLLAVDIDDTLTEKADAVSPRNIRAIRAAGEAGVMVTLATGRCEVGARPICEAIGLRGPAIYFGGSCVKDTRDGRTLLFQGVAPELVQEILGYAHALGVHAQIYQGDYVIFEEPCAFTERYTSFQNLPFRVEKDIRSRLYGDVPKVLVYAPTMEDEPALRAAFTERFAGRAAVSRSGPQYVEINAIGATKGNALAWLAAYLGVAREETAAAGDSYLDISMIRWAGTGVCMTNGVQEARDAADVIAPPCGEDGLAQFIETNILR